jgi:Rrf2 family protein
MQVSTRFAVAVHILTLLAQAEGGPLVSESIAGSVNTNPVVIRRVLGYLRRARLVVSQSGSGGGWTLIRDPHDISLREVYRAVESDPVLALHHQPNPACMVGRNIQQTLETIFTTAQSALEDSLVLVTVADVLAGVLAKAAA